MKAVSNKLGPRPKEELDRKLLTWVDQDMRSTQLVKIMTWQVTYSPPSE